MAQLGARLTGSQKVRGSSPLVSTILIFRTVIDGSFIFLILPFTKAGHLIDKKLIDDNIAFIYFKMEEIL